MRWISVAGVVSAGLVAGGCGKGGKRFEGPLPVTFGDCTLPTVRFVSGPRPAQFTEEEADRVWRVLEPPAPGSKTGDVPAAAPPPPPPPEDPSTADESGGTGTAMALDEGKLGSKREEGQYKMHKEPDPNDHNIYGLLTSDSESRAGLAAPSSRRAPSNTPMLSVGQPNANGDLDKAIIRRFVKRNIQKIQYCYEKQLLAKPSLAGTVTVQFFIKPDGTVATASAAGVDPEVASCVADVIKSIEFPKPKGGGGVEVNYPFTFRSAGDAGKAPAQAPAPAPPPPPVQPPPPKPQPAAVASVANERSLFRAYDAQPASAAYRTGMMNPLRSVEAPLTECLRKNPKPYGVAVVELHHASGAITATVDGLDDPAVAACVADAAKAASGPDTFTNERCAVAFGVMPPSELPAIEITAQAITLDGKRIEPSSADTLAIADLVVALAARLVPVLANTGASVTLHGPIAIRAVDAAPMKLVNGAMNSVAAAGDDFVLLVQRGSAWEPYEPIALPVVPVPVGTGARWGHLKSPWSSPASDGDDEHVRLSVYVTKQQIWVGLSRVNEFLEIQPGPDQHDKLAAALAEDKKSAFFVDRVDAEIGGDDDVRFADVLPAIDAVVKAGFTDWQLAAPSQLDARPTL